MKNVITYGTFDLLHVGHINLLRRAKALGSYLTVAVSTDAFNRLKHKDCLMPFEQRKAIIQSIKYVDATINEEDWEQKINDIQKYSIDIFAIGDDWQGKFDYLNAYCEVVYLPRTEGISSTLVKETMHSRLSVN